MEITNNTPESIVLEISATKEEWDLLLEELQARLGKSGPWFDAFNKALEAYF